MKPTLILLLLSIFGFNSLAQTIEYSLPPNLEKTISQKDYKIIADQSVALISKKYKIESVKDATVTLDGHQKFNLDNLISKCLAETITPNGRQLLMIISTRCSAQWSRKGISICIPMRP